MSGNIRSLYLERVKVATHGKIVSPNPTEEFTSHPYSTKSSKIGIDFAPAAPDVASSQMLAPYSRSWRAICTCLVVIAPSKPALRQSGFRSSSFLKSLITLCRSPLAHNPEIVLRLGKSEETGLLRHDSEWSMEVLT
jgi:hypothetical protein